MKAIALAAALSTAALPAFAQGWFPYSPPQEWGEHYRHEEWRREHWREEQRQRDEEHRAWCQQHDWRPRECH